MSLRDDPRVSENGRGGYHVDGGDGVTRLVQRSGEYGWGVSVRVGDDIGCGRWREQCAWGSLDQALGAALR